VAETEQCSCHNVLRWPLRPLTVKLRGRTTTSDKRRGRTLSPSARGAEPQAHHGPLERLLEAMLGTERNIRSAISGEAYRSTFCSGERPLL
jgi:hypothetical protein